MASSYARYLGTNYCPTDAEVLEIKDLIAGPIHQLLSLDEKIAQLRKSIEKLEESRQTLSSYVAQHSALISPIRRIPEDILSEIFFASLPTHRNCVMNASEAPVLLGRICSSWRAVSLTTPRLWAKLHIVEPRHDAVNAKVIQRLNTMKTWLGRSGQCPLSISLHSENFNEAPSFPHAEQAGMSAPPPKSLLNELISFVGRWKHVKFVAPRAAFQVLAQLTVTDVPILESVNFSLPNIIHPDVPDRNTDWTRYGIFNGPCVSSFSSSAYDFNDSMPLRWHLLTELSSLDDEKAWQTLYRCPQLRICELSHPPVELVYLHSLRLESSDMDSLLLTRLIVPNLRKFFLASCISHLDKATMHHLALRDYEYAVTLGSPFPFDDDILAMFALERESQCCCPSLQTLTIQAAHAISDRALQQFVVSRMTMAGTDAPPSLKRIRVQFHRPMELNIMAGLEPFMDAGLEIETRYMAPLPTFSPWTGLPDAPYPAWMPPGIYPAHW
ncbi:hypothetical protein R3P38DRAFT_3396062 [Favolaschia claudopus]|uniref:F-box domain-containing protein n=1 Tax=Favolaschia claudopus TaxID=2862362 RepID=A0AAW0BG08_9AGAR